MERLERDISYMEGLLEGLDLDPSSKEGRALFELIELNKKMVGELRAVKIRMNEQEAFIEALDEDLYEVESLLFDNLEDEEEGSGGMRRHRFKDRAETEQGESEEPGYVEMECPNCEELILIDEEGLQEGEEVELICPECKESIILHYGQEGEREEGNQKKYEGSLH